MTRRRSQHIPFRGRPAGHVERMARLPRVRADARSRNAVQVGAAAPRVLESTLPALDGAGHAPVRRWACGRPRRTGCSALWAVRREHHLQEAILGVKLSRHADPLPAILVRRSAF